MVSTVHSHDLLAQFGRVMAEKYSRGLDMLRAADQSLKLIIALFSSVHDSLLYISYTEGRGSYVGSQSFAFAFGLEIFVSQ